MLVPKYRSRKVFERVRRQVGEILRELYRQKGLDLLEGKAMPDHVHMLLSVPPKHSVVMTMGFLKGKSAVRIRRELLKTKGILFERAFWSRGYCVSTVGLEETMIRRYIQNQEKIEREQERGLFDET